MCHNLALVSLFNTFLCLEMNRNMCFFKGIRNSRHDDSPAPFWGVVLHCSYFSKCRNMIPASSPQLYTNGFALPIKPCGSTTLCWGRVVPDVGHAGHLSGDTALVLCPALSQAASYPISASCRFVDVQVHKFSLRHQGTKGRWVWDNFGYNKRLLNLKAFF